MASQYEIEHGIKPQAKRPSRRPDMSSFDALLDQVSTSGTRTSAHATFSAQSHHNPHATPTPVALASLYRLVQEQLTTLASNAPPAGASTTGGAGTGSDLGTGSNSALLASLIAELESSISDPPSEVRGVSQEFLDGLDRVPRGQLQADDSCPICAEPHLDDAYCLVVELPCHASHRFDLECVAPWLQSKGSCPMCRTDFTKKKAPVKVEDSEEEDDDPAGMFA
ncbi:hypothetical protein BROUX41_003465 [Berkeleyomyces rouxiae]|uniref:uncharacterized protein n=1 Tax=Berkeleyomyces rouxiae TaxID=2035830 RepID=UPI003B81C421